MTAPPRNNWAGQVSRTASCFASAESQFDLFVTADQNLRYQQNLTGQRIAILELSTNKLRRLQAAQQLILSTIASLRPGEFQVLTIP